jgi:protein TonB
MLNVLLESKAPRTRRVGGTMASTLVHAAIIAGAVAVTVPQPGRANDGPKAVPDIHYVDIHPQPSRIERSGPPAPNRTPTTPPIAGPVLKFNGPDVPPIHDVVVTTNTVMPDDFGGGGLTTHGPIGGPPGIGSPINGVVEERLVDRSPRLIGNPVPPVFPSALRYTGRGGRVLVEFVVDTTGRAEMDGFKVVQTADPLFAESVRDALPRYRFSPGEAGGRKVRTLVQLPFDFTLVR